MQGKFEKRNRDIHYVGKYDDAKVEDGDKGRLRKALKQLRKDRDEEGAARELLEEMQQNVDEAHARASESERRLCQELEEFMYWWDREIGRPSNLNTKIWQMMQCNSTKSDNLESDFAENLEKTCEGCLVVITDHGPQAEVARVFGHELLVDSGEGRLEGLEEERQKREEQGDG